MTIYHEDKNIIVCFKPAGIISQSSGGEDMISLLNEHFAGTAEAYPVHRLDRETLNTTVRLSVRRLLALATESLQTMTLKIQTIMLRMI